MAFIHVCFIFISQVLRKVFAIRTTVDCLTLLTIEATIADRDIHLDHKSFTQVLNDVHVLLAPRTGGVWGGESGDWESPFGGSVPCWDPTLGVDFRVNIRGQRPDRGDDHRPRRCWFSECRREHGAIDNKHAHYRVCYLDAAGNPDRVTTYDSRCLLSCFHR